MELDRGREGLCEPLPRDDLLERGDAAPVERRVDLLAQERERPLVRPGLAIDAPRAERVVDVADRQDPLSSERCDRSTPCG